MELHPILIDLRFNIIMKLITHKLIYRFNMIYIKTSPAFIFFHRNGKANPKIHMELEGTPNSQNNLIK